MKRIHLEISLGVTIYLGHTTHPDGGSPSVRIPGKGKENQEMRFSSLFFVMMLGVGTLGSSVATALTPDVPNIESRVVLIDWHAPHQVKGGIEPRSFPLELTREKASSGFALLVNDGGESEGWWTLEFDGEPLFGDPVYTDHGAWYLIPGDVMSAGKTDLTLQPGPGVTAPLKQVYAFTLDGTGEEVHFGSFIRSLAPKAQPPADPLQLQVEMLHLDLSITLNMVAANIPSASAEHTIRSLVDGLNQVALDFDNNNGNMQIHGSTFNGATTFSYSAAAGRLYINLSETMNQGDEFTVSVDYSGTPRPNRSYRRTTHGGGVPMVYTNNQPYDARLWIPCKDIPEDKFTTDIRVTIPDQSYNGWPLFAASIGTLVSNTPNDDDTRTFHWHSEYPVASYLISITCTNYRPAIGAYLSRDGSRTMEVAHYVLPQSYDSESPEVPNTIRILEFFADKFGEYPFLNDKYWTSTWGLNFGMEHQTVSSMPNGNLATPFHRRNIHELAHMWFGDAITCHTYDHLWLNEGWATYCEALAYEYLYGRPNYHQFVNSWATSDAFPIVSPRADEFNLSVVYRKGAWVLHMLRKIIGDELFFQGARNYMSDPDLLYGTALTEDLVRVYSETVGEDMSWYFDQWLYRAVRPTYDYTWSQEGTGTVTISIQQRQGGDPYRMPLDFLVRYTNGDEETHTLLNDRTNQSWQIVSGDRNVAAVTLDPDHWVLANKNLVGLPTPPAKPEILSVTGDVDAGTITVRWEPGSPGGFRLYTSPDGHGEWGIALDETTLTSSTGEAILDGYAPGDTAWFRVVRVDLVEGHHSEIYGASLGSGITVLNVDGYDRWPRQPFGGPSGHNVVAYHGNALAANGVAFDTVSNETAANPALLRAYDIVNWILAEESTQDSTFTPAEQALVMDFLEDGGRFFVSGNEIGWDLIHRAQSQADRDFYQQWLKADFLADDSGIYTVDGVGCDSIFGNVTFEYGGGDAPYFPAFPDLIAPVFGGETALVYRGSGAAAVQYFGTFGNGTTPGALVHFGFSFETISSPGERAIVMNAIVNGLMNGGPVPCREGMVVY